MSFTAMDFDFIEEMPAATATLRNWPDEDLPSAVAHFEKLLIGRALARSSGNRTEAARLLGIHRQLLYTKLKRYGLELPERRSDREDC
jgi:two-component system NtrC family response regulator